MSNGIQKYLTDQFLEETEGSLQARLIVHSHHLLVDHITLHSPEKYSGLVRIQYQKRCFKVIDYWDDAYSPVVCLCHTDQVKLQI
jgi:hypothetical protein